MKHRTGYNRRLSRCHATSGPKDKLRELTVAWNYWGKLQPLQRGILKEREWQQRTERQAERINNKKGVWQSGEARRGWNRYKGWMRTWGNRRVGVKMIEMSKYDPVWLNRWNRRERDAEKVKNSKSKKGYD